MPVGIEVFERDEKYDPRLDSIVRVEAGRLRSRLDEYYNGDGAASPIRISLPRGGYSAQFTPRRGTGIRRRPPNGRRREAGSRDDRGRRFRSRPACSARSPQWSFWLVAGAAIASAGPIVRPTAAVLAFEANMIGGDNSNYSRADDRSASPRELARLGTLSVASHTSAMQFDGQRRPMSEIAAALNRAYVVEASVDDEASELLVVARIVNAETDRKMWVSDYRGAARRCPRHRATHRLRRQRGDPETGTHRRHVHVGTSAS